MNRIMAVTVRCAPNSVAIMIYHKGNLGMTAMVYDMPERFPKINKVLNRLITANVLELAGVWISDAGYTDMSFVPVLKEGFFSITSVSRADLETLGFDVSNVTDDMMERIASKLADSYIPNGFWESLEYCGEMMEIPRPNPRSPFDDDFGADDE